MEKVSIKILEVDVKQVIEKIKELGATSLFEGNVKCRYFDFGDDKLRSSSKDLQLRELEDRFLLSYKEKINQDCKDVSKEYEIKLEKDNDLILILAGLGLLETSEVIKKRIIYEKDEVWFKFDQIEDFPIFLQIEGPNSTEVMKWVEKLSFSEDDALPWNGRDVWMHYKKKK